MAPPRSRPQPDDSRSETSSTKEKVNPTTTNTMNGKNRRAPGNIPGGSSLRDVVTAGPSGAAGGASATALAEVNPGLQWSEFDASILHAYRYEYHLNTPPAFNKSYNQIVLSRSPIGRMSPTMARKEQRRQGKEELAKSVRKHFKDMGLNENDVVVDFLYKVRWQDKNFRMRFAPPRPQPR